MVSITRRVFAWRSLATVSLCLLATSLWAQQAQHYMQTNLVSDVPGMAAATDPNLVNAWGMSRSSTSPWWISDNGTGITQLYTGTGGAVALGQPCPTGSLVNCVVIPTGDPNKSPTGTPTGQVFNGTADFELAPKTPARFIFVTEDGTVSGWAGGPAATIKVNTHGASVFKGVALATLSTKYGGTANYLYVADFRKGRVNVYNSHFYKVHLDGDAFEDEEIPHGFAPFNVQNIGGNIYVAFAQQDSEKHDEVDGAGLGYVDVFSPAGRLLHRLQHGHFMNAPWGMTQAPSDFGAYSHNILVGQFGSGQILVFDPVTGRFKGTLNDASDKPITIDGLWAIAFGGGTTSGPSNTLFFSAGINHEADGLFGTITAIENVLGGDL
ncbi:MAG TPA: TIGR03118 family protein [Terracidiphilus sp.]|nr:TIGR03118 family protein [Terracidiphilus sp.]